MKKNIFITLYLFILLNSYLFANSEQLYNKITQAISKSFPKDFRCSVYSGIFNDLINNTEITKQLHELGIDIDLKQVISLYFMQPDHIFLYSENPLIQSLLNIYNPKLASLLLYFGNSRPDVKKILELYEFKINGRVKIANINTIRLNIIERNKPENVYNIFIDPKTYLIHRFIYKKDSKDAVVNLLYTNIKKYSLLKRVIVNKVVIKDLGIANSKDNYNILEFSNFKINIGLKIDDFLEFQH